MSRIGRFGWSTMAIVAALALLALPAAAANKHHANGDRHANHRKHHRHHHGHPHRQAVRGAIKGSKVPVVKVPAAVNGKGGAGTPGDDYPANLKNRAQDSVIDEWGEYNRECTSFAAWALHSRNGFTMPFHDNANNWGPDAIRRGYVVNSSPAVGSIAWSNAGMWGHVAYVVGVGGGNVTIQEYNHYGNGTYDQRTVAASAFTGYIHFKDIAAEPPSAPVPAPVPPASPSVPTTPATPVESPATPTSPAAGQPSAPVATHAETTGGVTHTWTNYTNAGGSEGPTIPSNATVQIACAVSGFRVQDGNTWWYRIASSPWDGTYYASADAFYNNGQTSGSLIGTPFVDPAVPPC